MIERRTIAAVAGIILAGVVLAGVVASSACRNRTPPPNLVLITLDTTRPDRLGCYGHPTDNSPNLDAFAREATLFERAYATSSWTLPTHSSMFTGLLPLQHGAQSLPTGPNRSLGYGVRPLDERFETLAESLQNAGYRTGAVIAGPALRKDLGVAQGFEIYDDTFATKADKVHGRRAETVADAAIGLVEEFGEEPFFLFVNFFDPHAPYRPPPPFDQELPAPSKGDGAAQHEALSKLVESLKKQRPARTFEHLDEDLRFWLGRALAAYDAEIRYMDHHLGRLLDALDAGPRAERTLVVVTADHGESFGEHYYVSHGANLYEDNIRVPLLARGPGFEAGGRVAGPLSNVAAYGWLLEAAGLEPAGAVDPEQLGTDPRNLLIQVQRSDSNIRLFGSLFDRDLTALIRWPHKLIRSSRGEVELFDLADDPGELHDLAAARPDVVAALSGVLEEMTEERPPLYSPDTKAELDPATEEALRAMGYLD